MITLKNDTVETFTLLFTNPGAPGDPVTAVSSDPKRLAVDVGADSSARPAITLTPLVVAATGLKVMVYGANPDAPAMTLDVEIVEDRPPVSNPPVYVDTDNTVTRRQPVPTPALVAARTAMDRAAVDAEKARLAAMDAERTRLAAADAEKARAAGV